MIGFKLSISSSLSTYIRAECFCRILSRITGASLVVQGVKLCTPNVGDLNSIPGRGTRSRMLQLRVHIPLQTIPHAATKKDTAKTRLWTQPNLKSPGDGRWGRILASSGYRPGMLLNQQCTGHPHNKG